MHLIVAALTGYVFATEVTSAIAAVVDGVDVVRDSENFMGLQPATTYMWSLASPCKVETRGLFVFRSICRNGESKHKYAVQLFPKECS